MTSEMSNELKDLKARIGKLKAVNEELHTLGQAQVRFKTGEVCGRHGTLAEKLINAAGFQCSTDLVLRPEVARNAARGLKGVEDVKTFELESYYIVQVLDDDGTTYWGRACVNEALATCSAICEVGVRRLSMRRDRLERLERDRLQNPKPIQPEVY